MDLLTGGDLRYHLCKIRRFSEEETKFFIGCLLLGLEYIHNNNIIHRDIKPENLVSDDKGYIRITDFGVAKIRKEDNSSETSGTPGYMAPEVLMAQNHSFPVDFFAIGIMGYEFMMGQRPYIGKSRKEIKHLILQKQAKIDEDDVPEGWSLESVDFINRCLKRKESRRLGYNRGVIELKEHQWFEDFDWEGLYNKTISAPFVPKKAGNYDKKYCEGIEKISDTTLERYQTYLKKPNFKNIFYGYTYINTELIQNTETLSNITTGTKSNKVQIKTNTSMNNDKLNKLINNNLHININNIEKKIKNNDNKCELKQIKEDKNNNTKSNLKKNIEDNIKNNNR
jgi:serine/threonine protein kinase